MAKYDVTKKLIGDNLIGELTFKNVKLYPKVDAATIYKAMYHMDKAESAVNNYNKNPENHVFKAKMQNAALDVYEAITIIYVDEEYAKLMNMKLFMDDMAILVREAIDLFEMREAEAKKNKN